MRSFLKHISHVRNRYLLLFDALVLLMTPYLAIYFRTENTLMWQTYAGPLAVFAMAATMLKLAVYLRLDMYSQYWPYASVPELVVLLRATAVGALLEIALFLVCLLGFDFIHAGFPRSMPWLDGVLSAVFIGSTRFGIRAAAAINAARTGEGPRREVLIVGAGVAGAMVVKELQANEHLGKIPVGYVDDDPEKLGKWIHGIKVLGMLSELPVVLKATKAKHVIIAIPTAPGKLIRQIMQMCEAAGVTSKTVPGLFEIIRGTSRIDQVRNVQLEDLLRRGAVRSDGRRVMNVISGARVLVTGAGGSIGSEICRQVMDFGPSELVLLGHGENSIFHIASELRDHPRKSVEAVPVIADIRDRKRMEQVFADHRPEIVFHAAAHKHLPLMEVNVPDAVTNNVLGTSTLVDLAVESGTDRFVMISTDKAVNPTSILGVTKRIAEMIVHDAGRQSGRKYVATRFGNVLGSRGSVVPIFERQIRSGGPITVTHPDVKRFFMTIPEAVQLVLQSATMGEGGEVFVLDMGEQIKIVDLARDLLRLNGLQEGRDIDIVFTGLKPGEKMLEELFFEGDRVERTDHEKIMVCRNGFRGPGMEEGRSIAIRSLLLGALVNSARQGDVAEVYRGLQRLVPQYVPPCATDEPAAPTAPLDLQFTARREPVLPDVKKAERI